MLPVQFLNARATELLRVRGAELVTFKLLI